MRSCILIVIAIWFVGCNKDQDPAVDKTVHLAGYVGMPPGAPLASYWKDGVYTDLTDPNVYSQVTSLYVDNSSVFVGGYKVSPTLQSVYWQDGAETQIAGVKANPLIAARNNNLFGVWLDEFPGWWVYYKNGSKKPMVDTVQNIGPNGLTLVGDDMYITGVGIGLDQKQHAQYWKNGQLMFREREISNSFSIVIHDDDVYMAGYRELPDLVACYWKNGQRIELTKEGDKAIARSIYVTDSHVYVAGTIDQQAVYWKDGEAVYLTSEGTYSMANAIFVQGEDIHAAGYEHNHPAYWKNNAKQDIENQEKQGQVLFMVVGSN